MTFRLRTAALGLVLALASGAAFADAPAASPTVLAVDGPSSAISYKIVHKLHEVEATSKKSEGKLAILPDGKLQVMVRAAINTFDSGNSNRDEHMQETMEADKYPQVAFKGVGQAKAPIAYPSTQKIDFQGELDFHGQKRWETIPVEVTFTSPTEVHAKANFNVSLDAYKVERPSLLLVKIDDACQVGMDMVLRAEKK